MLRRVLAGGVQLLHVARTRHAVECPWEVDARVCVAVHRRARVRVLTTVRASMCPR